MSEPIIEMTLREVEDRLQDAQMRQEAAEREVDYWQAQRSKLRAAMILDAAVNKQNRPT